jgi:flagellar biosynthesis/type III secretory pathway M-ring protein FliF/YscJ
MAGLTRTNKLIVLFASAILIGISLWAFVPRYRILSSGLTIKDADAIVRILGRSGINHIKSADNSVISVTPARLEEARLEIARRLPKMKGWLVYDSQTSSTNDDGEFLDKINRYRQIEKVLAATVVTMPGVKSAEIHLDANPDQQTLETTPSSASVYLALSRKKLFSSDAAKTIANLISLSVKAVPRENVTVYDDKGHRLFGTGKRRTTGGPSTRAGWEENISSLWATRTEEALAESLGDSKIIVRIRVESSPKVPLSVYREYFESQGLNESPPLKSLSIEVMVGEKRTSTPGNEAHTAWPQQDLDHFSELILTALGLPESVKKKISVKNMEFSDDSFQIQRSGRENSSAETRNYPFIVLFIASLFLVLAIPVWHRIRKRKSSVNIIKKETLEREDDQAQVFFAMSGSYGDNKAAYCEDLINELWRLNLDDQAGLFGRLPVDVQADVVLSMMTRI